MLIHDKWHLYVPISVENLINIQICKWMRSASNIFTSPADLLGIQIRKYPRFSSNAMRPRLLIFYVYGQSSRTAYSSSSPTFNKLKMDADFLSPRKGQNTVNQTIDSLFQLQGKRPKVCQSSYYTFMLKNPTAYLYIIISFGQGSSGSICLIPSDISYDHPY